MSMEFIEIIRMGVHGLQSFVEKHCFDVCEHVDVKTLAIRYKVETGRNPVIVVDGPSCLKSLYSKLNWMCGGQYKEFIQVCINFVKSFEEHNIKLVFFFDGPTVNIKRDTWIERRKKNMNDIEKFFLWLDSDDTRIQKVSHYMQLPVGINSYSRYIFKHICGCEVHISVKECDEEIAAYARRHSCFAILGQDSDFLIHPTTQYYFSMNKMGFPSLVTINYNRWALARNLRISVDHLPLFASLMGNDIVPLDKLKRYHERISNSRTSKPRDIAHNIAKYIREIPMGNAVYALLPLICRDVFQDASMSNLVAESIWSYLPHSDEPVTGCSGSHWDKILFIATQKHQRNEIPSSVFGVLKEMPFESGAVMEDFTKRDIPPTAILLRKARERLYSVLLHEAPQNQTVHEWCVSGKESLNNAHPIAVPMFHQFHRVRHPGLRILWDSRTDIDTMNMRWGLIAWILSSNIQVSKLKMIPNHLIVPALTLYFLINEVEESFLKEKEINLLIIVAITIHEHDCEELENLFVGKPLPRGVRVSTTYLRVAVQVFNIIGACGFPVHPVEIMPHTYFDGKYFQDLFMKMESGFDVTTLINERDDYKALYLQVKDFLLN